MIQVYNRKNMGAGRDANAKRGGVCLEARKHRHQLSLWEIHVDGIWRCGGIGAGLYFLIEECDRRPKKALLDFDNLCLKGIVRGHTGKQRGDDLAKESRKEQAARKQWFQYFNRTLRNANLLTEQEYLAMMRAIDRHLSD